MINSILVLVQNERKNSVSTSFEELSAKLDVVVLANSPNTSKMEDKELQIQCQLSELTESLP